MHATSSYRQETKMKENLPDRKEYYRPARAKELRRQRKSLRRWQNFLVALILIGLATIVFATQWSGYKFFGFLIASVAALTIFCAIMGWCKIDDRCDALTEQATTLEREHKARQVALPSESEE